MQVVGRHAAVGRTQHGVRKTDKFLGAKEAEDRPFDPLPTELAWIFCYDISRNISQVAETSKSFQTGKRVCHQNLVCSAG